MNKKIPAALMLSAAMTIPTFAFRISGALPVQKTTHIPWNKLTSADYLPGTVILKLKPEYRAVAYEKNIGNRMVEQYLAAVGAYGLEKKFKDAAPPARERNERGERFADLSLIYEFHYSAELPLRKVITWLQNTGLFEYVEPHYISRYFFTPNDPNISLEWHLTNIEAYTGWNISKGDTNTVIGIVDSGTDTNHPDLMANFKYNYSDPVNSSDDDGDGYVDNYLGWDFAGNDNNTQVAGNDHGVHVAGDASAVTDNGTGVAAPGFKCKILPVRAGDATIPYGYEGITYAADHGANIINCSWGSSYGGSLGQDIIDYATINKNALVVAACGNDGLDVAFYPAAYNYVISTAATQSDDTRASYSNYNYTVDVSAPGDDIYSSGDGGGYYFSSGTSMASPVAAGCAAVIHSYFPSYTAIQVGEQLKATSDNIDMLHSPTYRDKIGKGRVNLYRALSVTNLPSVEMTQTNFSDNNDDVFVINDTLRISGLFTNYLAATGNVTGTLTAVAPTNFYVTILDNSTTLGSIGTMATADNNSDPFKVKINSNAPLNTTVIFKLTLTDGSYTTKFFFTVSINVDYINIAVNEVTSSATSRGLIGYNGPSQTEGLGFKYKGNALLYDASIMIGIASGPKVSDRARGSDGTTADEDFTAVDNVHAIIPPAVSDFDAEGIFNDDGAGTGKLNVAVKHKYFAWNKAGHTKYIIQEYTITNNGTSSLNSLYAGIFADWDIMTYSLNKANYDTARKLGYCFSTEANGLYAGIQALTDNTPKCYSIDNDGLNGTSASDTLNIYNGYPTNEKYITLANLEYSAGGSGTGADVSHVISAGPFNLAASDSVVVAFAIMAGDSLPDLLKTADSAYAQYNGYPPSVGISEVTYNLIEFAPNPASQNAIIDVGNALYNNINITIYNAGGKLIQHIKYTGHNGRIPVELSRMESGVYFCRIETERIIVYRKLIVGR